MENSLDYNRNRWNRMLLNGFWLLLLLTILLESLYLPVTYLPSSQFVMHYIALPTLFQLIVLLLAETGLRLLSDRFKDYMLIAASALLSTVIVNVHIEINYLLLALFCPVIVSIFYFHTKKLLFALGCTLASLYGLYFFNSYMHEDISQAGLATITMMFASYSLIGWGVLLRGRELTSYYRTITKSNQELLVKTIVMDKLAKTDALTELYNHITFHEYLDKLIEHHDTNGMPLQLALIDIDNFKSVNDTYGHRAGDVVLRTVADIVRAEAGQNDFVARYGGEEFAVIFTEITPERSLKALEQIRHDIAQIRHEVLGERYITVSTGFSSYRPHEGKEPFFQRTDQALYLAKKTGKNRVVDADVAELKVEQLV
ncbi:sensor domain-containing diguanylate cyclase [Paenibacillus beijingensis]|uniref:GGDEF domain-containing protein n=1 Tax=Paenibacillus beijingensis TaxID=1126833 RepID=A0A0D5NLL8_9BACL|nr:GGDEF domain-containing protein [Paenibacillus beijingensis]AJY75823.1 hypothetical protein VN24_16260 [Paenibacillus beijingensis]